jgi:predicted adenylyl cyclase CyaB
VAHLNVEIKARCPDPAAVRAILRELKADFRGRDRQVDTYFACDCGRLKLREGDIETALIHYVRDNLAGPKDAVVHLYKPSETRSLKEILSAVFDVKIRVDKRREIYFIENVKFHIDEVDSLGSFVEIEAIDADNSRGRAKLLEQAQKYMQLLGIRQEDLMTHSYSDMLLRPSGR